eukprot:UN30305
MRKLHDKLRTELTEQHEQTTKTLRSNVEGERRQIQKFNAENFKVLKASTEQLGEKNIKSIETSKELLKQAVQELHDATHTLSDQVNGNVQVTQGSILEALSQSKQDIIENIEKVALLSETRNKETKDRLLKELADNKAKQESIVLKTADDLKKKVT